jgi:hypothetical protein
MTTVPLTTPAKATILPFTHRIGRLRTNEIEIWLGFDKVAVIDRVSGRQTRWRICLPRDPKLLREVATELQTIAADIAVAP